MKKLSQYNSFHQLKEKAKAMHPVSVRSVERHNQFEESLRILRQEYVQAKAAPESKAPIS
jgi:hypothetical protein